ncbi:MAG: rod shape-determining protein MreD [Acetobacter sp.]|uniref:rod shape-determining protein MreD n=1 Tax=Acetobacter sp. TaxID=440 RepID=UPI0039E8D3D6
MPSPRHTSWDPETEPQLTLRQRLDRTARHLLPTIFAILAIIVFSAPLGLPGAAELLPAIVLSTVFFWSVWRPSGMPALNVFVLGLFMDLVGFTPLGVSAFILLLVHGTASYARFGLMRLNFLVVWCVVGLVGAGAAALQWTLACVFRLHALDPAPAFFEALLCIGIYPLLSATCSWFLRVLDEKDAA